MSSDQQDLRREIMAYCNKKLPSYKVPKKIFFVDEFPLNASNKVDLAALKEICTVTGDMIGFRFSAICCCTESTIFSLQLVIVNW